MFFRADNRGLGCIFISDLKCNFKLLQLPKYRELVLRLDRATKTIFDIFRPVARAGLEPVTVRSQA